MDSDKTELWVWSVDWPHVESGDRRQYDVTKLQIRLLTNPNVIRLHIQMFDIRMRIRMSPLHFLPTIFRAIFMQALSLIFIIFFIYCEYFEETNLHSHSQQNKHLYIYSYAFDKPVPDLNAGTH